MKKIISIILSVAVIISQGITFVASAKEDNTVYDTSVTDMLVFGDDSSENEHNLTEKMSVTGIDEKAEAQYKDENGKYAGGGQGDGLSETDFKTVRGCSEGNRLFTLYFKGRHRTSELYNRAFIGKSVCSWKYNVIFG